jgi:uncharacterized protein YdiU (UPF0061 family)
VKALKHSRQLAALLPLPPSVEESGELYAGFHQINGHHPFRFAMPQSYIDYPARILKGCRVVWTNYNLMKEIGLLAEDHPNQINPKLEKTLLDTFALRIVNEYDQLTGLKVAKSERKTGRYMATRYLQLQHQSRTGETSGDGRSIWNGQYIGKDGTTWDFSSCGTGATQLSPAYAIMGRPIKTGDKQVSYGSGLADVDEGLSAAILSEALLKKGIHTERTLLVIETPEGKAINVRAARNLLRPSHLFLHLKQGNRLLLQAAWDFHRARQINNGNSRLGPGSSNEDYLLYLAQSFGRFAAQLQEEYIFCWIDWDGDNLLLEGGIIDYGSIRSMGLCHHRYRYEDVDRYSSSLLEQKRKTREIVAVFCQLVHFLETGQKVDFRKFFQSKATKLFESTYTSETEKLILRRFGLFSKKENLSSEKYRHCFDSFASKYRALERREWGRGYRKTPDGINSPAILDIRNLAELLPRQLLVKGSALTPEEFLALCETPFLTKKERQHPSLLRLIASFQNSYLELLHIIYPGKSTKRALLEATVRASHQSQVRTITGDGIIHVVDQLMKWRGKLSRGNFQLLVDALIHWQRGETVRRLSPKIKKRWETLLHIAQKNKFSL